MVYFLGYLSLGMFLVVLKSPIRKLVDWEVANLKMHCLIRDEDYNNVKLLLFRLVLSFIIVVIYPVILFRRFVDFYNTTLRKRDCCIEPIESELAWLYGEITVENAEAANVVKIDSRNVPFGYSNSQWLYILEIMEEGDKLYEFRSPEESWKCFAGIEGIALVKNGEIVADLVILLN